MKIKNLFIAFGMALVSLPAMAQYEGTEWEDRIGTGEDSLRARQNLSMFNIAIRNNSFEEAYESWRPVIEKAPFANLRIYTDGAYMLQMLIQNVQDPAKKKQFFEELMKQLYQPAAKPGKKDEPVQEPTFVVEQAQEPEPAENHGEDTSDSEKSIVKATPETTTLDRLKGWLLRKVKEVTE